MRQGNRRGVLLGLLALAAMLPLAGEAAAADVDIYVANVQGIGAISVPIDVQTKAGNPPSTLTIEVVFDPGELAFTQVRTGPAAANAGKTASGNLASGNKVNIVVAGLNTNAMADGVVAYLGFDILTAPQGTAQVGDTLTLAAQNASAADGTGTGLDAAGFGGSIVVQDVLGDANGDGSVNAIDVAQIINMVIGAQPATALGDLDGNGMIDAVDAQRVINIALGLPVIRALSPDWGQVGTNVAIYGANFGTNAGELEVRFGGPSGPLSPSVTNVTENRLEAEVPSGLSLGLAQVTVKKTFQLQPSNDLDFEVTQAGAIDHLVFTAGPPGSVVAGQGFSVTVEARDASDNLVNYSGEVSLGFAVNAAGNATLGGAPLTMNASGGSATFSGLWIDKAATGYALRATVLGIPPADSGSFSVQPGTAAQLVFVQQPPASVTVGQGFQVEVGVGDSFGNLTGSGDAITLSPGAGSAGGLGGSLTQSTGPDGVAVFGGISADTAGSYTLQADGAGFTRTSQGFTATGGGVATLSVYQQPPASVQEGSAFTVVVHVLDTGGQLDGSATDRITASIAAGGGSLAAGATLEVDAQGGVATFDNLIIAGSGSGFQLRFSASGFPDVLTNAFTVTGAGGDTTPPSLLAGSSRPTEGDELTFDEAFNPPGSGQLGPARFVFDEPIQWNPGTTPVIALSWDDGQTPQTLIESQHYALSYDSGTNAIVIAVEGNQPHFNPTPQAGGTLEFSISDVRDAADNVATPVTLSVVVDSAPPMAQSWEGQGANHRAIFSFNEAIAPSTTSTFQFTAPSAQPVALDPGGSALLWLDATTTVFYAIPADLLPVGNPYTVSCAGFTDAAGNPVQGGNQYQFDVQPGWTPQAFDLVQVDFVDIVSPGTNDFTVLPSAVHGGGILLPASIIGGAHELRIKLSQPVNSNWWAGMEGPGLDEVEVQGAGTDTMIINPRTGAGGTPGFVWQPGAYEVWYPGGGGDRELMLFVPRPGDGIAPKVVALAGRRGEAGLPGGGGDVAADPDWDTAFGPVNAVLRQQEPLIVGFSELVDPASLALTLHTPGGDTVPVLWELVFGGARAAIAIRAQDGSGKPIPFEEGNHTLRVEVEDATESPLGSDAYYSFAVQRALAAPSLQSSLPTDGDTLVAHDLPAVMLGFDDAMDLSTFVDTGPPAERGFRLEEELVLGERRTGLYLAKRGYGLNPMGPVLSPGSFESVALSPVQGGLQPGRGYHFHVLAGARSIDGVGATPASFSFETVHVSQGGWLVNELNADPAGEQFVEIYAGWPGMQTVQDMALVFMDGATPTSTISAVLNLSGMSTDQSGLLVLGTTTTPAIPAAAMGAECEAVIVVGNYGPGGTLSTGDPLAMVFGDPQQSIPGFPVNDMVVFVTGGADPIAQDLAQRVNQVLDEHMGGDMAAHSLQRDYDGKGGNFNASGFVARAPTQGATNGPAPNRRPSIQSLSVELEVWDTTPHDELCVWGGWQDQPQPPGPFDVVLTGGGATPIWQQAGYFGNHFDAEVEDADLFGAGYLTENAVNDITLTVTDAGMLDQSLAVQLFAPSRTSLASAAPSVVGDTGGFTIGGAITDPALAERVLAVEVRIVQVPVDHYSVLAQITRQGNGTLSYHVTVPGDSGLAAGDYQALVKLHLLAERSLGQSSCEAFALSSTFTLSDP